MFESLQALEGGQSEICVGYEYNHVMGNVRYRRWCPAPSSIEPIGTLTEHRDTRTNTRATDKPERHTFGEIRSKILVQLVKVGSGDNGRVQWRVIDALVRRTLCAVLIAGEPRIGGRGRGGRCAGGARRPLHGVHSAGCGREREGDRGVGVRARRRTR